jgi:hypothetical protein
VDTGELDELPGLVLSGELTLFWEESEVHTTVTEELSSFTDS